jgi:hypothetical protein
MSTSVDGLFGDNYFDLLPGEVKSLFFETTQKLTSADIKVKTLFDIE